MSATMTITEFLNRRAADTADRDLTRAVMGLTSVQISVLRERELLALGNYRAASREGVATDAQRAKVRRILATLN